MHSQHRLSGFGTPHGYGDHTQSTKARGGSTATCYTRLDAWLLSGMQVLAFGMGNVVRHLEIITTAAIFRMLPRTAHLKDALTRLTSAVTDSPSLGTTFLSMGIPPWPAEDLATIALANVESIQKMPHFEGDDHASTEAGLLDFSLLGGPKAQSTQILRIGYHFVFYFTA